MSTYSQQATFDIDAVFQSGDITIAEFIQQRKLQGSVQLDTTDEEALLTGTPHERFIVEGAIARGGMGMILSVRDLNIRRSIAMKVLTSDSPSDKQILRFIEEAQITGQLEHPNIIPVHELGISESGRVFYTMKLVSGVTLLDIIKGIREHRKEFVDKYPLGQLLTIFTKVCDAIAFAHAHDVIHRDLKPDNIMIGDYGEVLLMDWGLAKVVGERARQRVEDIEEEMAAIEAMRNMETLDTGRPRQSMSAQRTLEGQILGTPNYMAPEQAAGRISELDHRTDIYALGGIMYDLLCLRPPIDGASLKEMVHKIKKGEIPLPSIYNPRKSKKGKMVHPDNIVLHQCPDGRVPEPCIAVAMKALALSQQDRYQTVEDLQRDIFNYQSGFATTAESASSLRLFWLTVKRHKREAALAIASLILIIGLATVLVGYFYRANQENAAIVAQLEEEKQARSDFQRQLAPKLINEAEQLMKRNEWDAAMEKANEALELNAELGNGWLTLGRVHIASLKLGEAAKALERASEIEGTHNADSQKLLEVAKQFDAEMDNDGKLQDSRIYELATSLSQLDEKMLTEVLLGRVMSVHSAEGPKTDAERKALELAFKAARESMQLANPNQTRLRFTPSIKSTGVRVDLSGNSELMDISALAGLPIQMLNFEGCGRLTDLGPLAGMSLRELGLEDTAVEDLGPIKGAPITELNIQRSQVAKLDALAGSPLKKLLASQAEKLSDLSGLQGAPLTEVILDNTKVRDLSPLKGAELTILDLRNCPVTDLSPLAGMPLKTLNLAYTKVSDLSPLRGAPLETLELKKAPVSNLTGLEGSPLTSLNLSQTQVTSLAPLKGVPLGRLYADDTPLASLVGLEGAPLTILNVSRTKVTDMTPILKSPLSTLYIPPQLRNLLALRAVTSLTQISDRNGKLYPAATFWKAVEGGR
ncbi:MAG: serine/threonine protein kinase [Rhodothermales bacterium]|jgi:serine/threonine protein kinase